MAVTSEKNLDSVESFKFPDCQHVIVALDRVRVEGINQLGTVLLVDPPHAFVRLDNGYEDGYHLTELRLLGH